MNRKIFAIIMAILAAAFYAINVPFSKILLHDVDPSMMSSLLYLGAGISMTVLFIFQRHTMKNEDLIRREDLRYTVGMIILDIAAPILLMYGITLTTPENVSLMNNFEIVATSLIALAIFKEMIGKDLWIAIVLISLSGIILTVDGTEGFTLNTGSLCVLGASICWGLENNCTRAISERNTTQIVMVKGIFSGMGCFAIALASGEHIPGLQYINEFPTSCTIGMQ